MDKGLLDRMIAMMASGNDADAVMGLRGVQGLFEAEGASLGAALLYGAANIGALKAAQKTVIDHAPPAAAQPAPPAEISGMPQCHAPCAGCIAIVPAGKTGGDVVALPGAAAEEAADIALHLKDALVAAVLNKSRFRLKVLDVKNGRGEVVETVLQAEYEREGMTPIRVWSNVKGEVAALASVLRRAVANSVPELWAA